MHTPRSCLYSEARLSAEPSLYNETKTGGPWWKPHSRRTIHGQIYLPPGYDIIVLPRFIEVEEFNSNRNDIEWRQLELSSNYSVFKALTAAAQICFGAMTLYRNKGNRIETYGCGTLGFTVVPYMFMSFMNLFAGLCCRQYPTMFLVESTVMDEARKRGAKISGTVGRVKESADSEIYPVRSILSNPKSP